jgi:hypothetical protein
MSGTTSPQLSKRALFEQLGYRPHKGQIAVHRSKARRRVLACGTRFGKSTLGAAEAVAELMMPRESALGWVVAPSLQLTERVFLRVSRMVMAHLPHLVIEHVPRHMIRMHNLSGGISELHAMSADRPHALLGAALDFLVVDESSHIRDNVWSEYLSPRLVDKNGSALLLSTPRDRNWFYDEYKRGRPGKDPAYQSWQMPSWENPFIKKERIEAERARLGEVLFAQQYGAQFSGPPEPCELCGGPSPDVTGLVTLLDEAEPASCPACGAAIDSNGKTLVHLRDDGPFLSITRIVTHGLTAGEIGNIQDWNAGARPA